MMDKRVVASTSEETIRIKGIICDNVWDFQTDLKKGDVWQFELYPLSCSYRKEVEVWISDAY